eukprot:TRINITY_DN36232_c0_g1_i1.p1 TRINITY_DN36232_c0_g1~~TRINITY_DN36232_c0_g1_i1.p1  ORF type:complete len:377 (+),score=97.37 TRINITY_DN36232_c0_g1_i1:139-1269(+)
MPLHRAVWACAFGVAVLPVVKAVRVDDDEEEGQDDGLETGTSMLRWAVQSKVQGAEDLYFKKFPKGPDNFPVRGLAARKDYRKGDEVVRIPGDVLMWSRSGNLVSSHLSQLPGVPAQLLEEECAGVVSMEEGDCDRLRLAAALMATREGAERKEGGDLHWAPYVRNLPSWEDFWMYHPVAGDELLLKSFDKLPIVKNIRDTQATTNRRFEVYKKLGGKAAEKDFKWANLVVHAYCWGGVHGRGEMIAPVGDSFNTATPEQQNLAEVREGTELPGGDWAGSFVFRATKDIPAGAELLDNYQSDVTDDSFTASWGFPLRGSKESQLTPADCKELMGTVGSSMKSVSSSCRAPAEQPQAVAFCSLSRLALEHCSPESQF